MKVYVEAFRHNGTQILGNLDGQAVINARNYKRTDIYKRLVMEPKEKLSLGGCAALYKIVTSEGRVLQTIQK